jgi:hypothetical protein
MDIPFNPSPSLAIKNHSPTGFNWGYGGSGPSQLALGIIYDVTGDEYLSESVYQQFKWDFVSKWGDEWSITEDEVVEWVNARKVEMN